MAAKRALLVVLLGVFLVYRLYTPSNDRLPSWPMFYLGLALQRSMSWLRQAITPPHLWLTKEMTGFATSKAIYIACELEVADKLTKGPLSSAEISQLAGTDPERTERIMKYLAIQGVFQRSEAGLYANTAASEFMKKDHPQSMRAYYIIHGFEGTMMFQKYNEAVRNATFQSFSAAFNTDKDVWDIMEDPANIKMKTNFDQAMTDLSTNSLPPILKDFHWGKYSHATIVDVGGGKGHVTAAVLRDHPSFRGVVFDLEKGISGAKQYLSTRFPEEYSRITLTTGSFFDRVPSGGDFYILKYILHDWSDENCVQILRTVARALRETAETSDKQPSLLVMEHIYEYPPVSPFVAFMDMMMLGILGRERSLSEFEDLLQQAGLKLVTVHPTRSLMTIMEVQLK